MLQFNNCISNTKPYCICVFPTFDKHVSQSKVMIIGLWLKGVFKLNGLINELSFEKSKWLSTIESCERFRALSFHSDIFKILLGSITVVIYNTFINTLKEICYSFCL